MKTPRVSQHERVCLVLLLMMNQIKGVKTLVYFNTDEFIQLPVAVHRLCRQLLHRTFFFLDQ